MKNKPRYFARPKRPRESSDQVGPVDVAMAQFDGNKRFLFFASLPTARTEYGFKTAATRLRQAPRKIVTSPRRWRLATVAAVQSETLSENKP